jgi:hypothetical protein
MPKLQFLDSNEFLSKSLPLLHSNPFSSPLSSEALARNPLLEAISLHGPTGPLPYQFLRRSTFNVMEDSLRLVALKRDFIAWVQEQHFLSRTE